MLTELQFNLLRWISPGEPGICSGAAYLGKSKLKTLLGDLLLNKLRGKTVIDFGCGDGTEAVEMARAGAERVLGVDIQEKVLKVAREKAQQAGVGEVCIFSTTINELADVIVSIDAFEHFSNPSQILQIMYELLKPGGECLVSFGPTWYHPMGGHLFSMFPWAHLVFSERALLRWRSTFKSDGATKFCEVEGGLNQMTIREFETVVAGSQFKHVTEMETVPIRKLRVLHNHFTREFTTAIVRCRLVKQPG